MNCRRVRRFLFSYFKNELSEDEKEKIKFHLESCPDCARESLEVERVSSLVKTSLETLTPSPDFNQKLLLELQKLTLEKAEEVKGRFNLSLLTSHFPLRVRWALAGSLAVIILASVLWFAHRPVPNKPEAISKESKREESFELVNTRDREDSSSQEMSKRMVKSPGLKTKTFVLDNFKWVGTRGIDGMERPEDMYKRFIIETAGYGVEQRRVGSHYVLPAVSVQQTSERVNY
jgi:hypothetical protein